MLSSCSSNSASQATCRSSSWPSGPQRPSQGTASPHFLSTNSAGASSCSSVPVASSYLSSASAPSKPSTQAALTRPDNGQPSSSSTSLSFSGAPALTRHNIS